MKTSTYNWKYRIESFGDYSLSQTQEDLRSILSLSDQLGEVRKNSISFYNLIPCKVAKSRKFIESLGIKLELTDCVKN